MLVVVRGVAGCSSGWGSTATRKAPARWRAHVIRVHVYPSGHPSLSGIIGALPVLWWFLNVLFSILGGVKVKGGGNYRYPFALRLLK